MHAICGCMKDNSARPYGFKLLHDLWMCQKALCLSTKCHFVARYSSHSVLRLSLQLKPFTTIRTDCSRIDLALEWVKVV